MTVVIIQRGKLVWRCIANSAAGVVPDVNFGDGVGNALLSRRTLVFLN